MFFIVIDFYLLHKNEVHTILPSLHKTQGVNK